MRKIETLSQFYDLMFETREIRQRLVGRCLMGSRATRKDVGLLSEALQLLRNIPRIDDRYSLRLGDGHQIEMDLSYETDELVKDIHFFTRSEGAFYAYLKELHPEFEEELEHNCNIMGKIQHRNFITDRDGTVNNYCGRYRSAIQSAYNAMFLSRFAMNAVEHAVILTSAPLVAEGIVDISVAPAELFIYAGSKGRELMSRDGRICRYPIEKNKQLQLDRLNRRLSELVNCSEYGHFSLIGSGLQFKFGQTTIARQDIHGSIPEQESEAFLEIVQRVVAETDPEGVTFRIEDTGKDIEIILTVRRGESDTSLKDFDKGDGVMFINDTLGLHLENGPNLICGDTGSDIPMVGASLQRTDETWAIFVTRDESLKKEVRNICPNSLFFSEPDMLVAFLNEYGKVRAL